MAQPKLSGIFASLTNATAHWDAAQWTTDMESMKRVGMSFFVLPRPATVTRPPTAACPLGGFDADFAVEGLGECFTQVGDLQAPGGTAMTVLAAAAATGLRVHMGLALTEAAADPYNATLVPAYATLQATVARHLWGLATAANLTSVVSGFYTEVEQYNSAWWMPEWRDWTLRYLEPLAADVKALRADLLVWSSPYSVGNIAQHTKDAVLCYAVLLAVLCCAMLCYAMLC